MLVLLSGLGQLEVRHHGSHEPTKLTLILVVFLLTEVAQHLCLRVLPPQAGSWLARAVLVASPGKMC